MRRHRTDLDTALPVSLAEWAGPRNPVMRVGAFSEGQSAKAALGYGYRSRVKSGQTTPRKEIDRLSSGLASGGGTAPCKALLRGNADIRAQVPHYFRPRAVTVGAEIGCLKHRAVNGAEIMATGQSVSTLSGVAPTVRRGLSKMTTLFLTHSARGR